MARIRSIKPQFWTDGKIRRLSDTTALFFISLWNFCDDSGFIELDTLEISMKVARWRSQDIMRLLRGLHGAGMIRLSTSHGLVMIASWQHQKIDKPRPSKWKDKEIQWDEVAVSGNATRTFDARIGEDRIGEDILPAPSKIKKSPLIRMDKILNLKVWDAYREEYLTRYRVEPVRNASVNAKISQIAKRLGDDAPEVVRFFVNHPDSFYVRAMHSIGLCLRDAEALSTQWRKGKAITSNDMRNYERNQGYQQIIDDINAGKV